jgi:hypothetical protein
MLVRRFGVGTRFGLRFEPVGQIERYASERKPVDQQEHAQRRVSRPLIAIYMVICTRTLLNLLERTRPSIPDDRPEDLIRRGRTIRAPVSLDESHNGRETGRTSSRHAGSFRSDHAFRSAESSGAISPAAPTHGP